jgi:amphi-Trp domain-containing protein
MDDDDPTDRIDDERQGESADAGGDEGPDGDGGSGGEAFEVEREATRREAAALLHDLADGVASGSVAFDDGAFAVDVPETVGLEVEYEREADESEIEVELAWTTADAVDADAADTAESERDGGEDGAGDVEDEGDADGTEHGEDDEIGIEAGETDAENLGALADLDTGPTEDADGTGEGPGSEVESGADSEETAEAGGEGEETAEAGGEGEETAEIESAVTAEAEGESIAAAESAVAGLVEPSDAVRSRARFELYRDRAGRWRWRLVHHNGNIIADGGGGYTRKANARKGLTSVKRNAPGALVVENE